MNVDIPPRIPYVKIEASFISRAIGVQAGGLNVRAKWIRRSPKELWLRETASDSPKLVSRQCRAARRTRRANPTFVRQKPKDAGRDVSPDVSVDEAATSSSWRGALMRALRVQGASPFSLHADGNRVILMLTGAEIERLGEWLVGLERAGDGGVGRARQRFSLSEARVNGALCLRDGSIIAEPEERAFEVPSAGSVADVRVDLITPLRLCVEGKPLRAVSANDLFFALARRAARLEGPSRKTFRAPTFGGTWSAATRFVDARRYSSRQGRSIGIGGVVGTIRLQGCNDLHRAWLAFGECFGVGKATSMGAGVMTVSVT